MNLHFDEKWKLLRSLKYCKSKTREVSCKSLANHQESASGMSDRQGIPSEDNLQSSIAQSCSWSWLYTFLGWFQYVIRHFLIPIYRNNHKNNCERNFFTQLLAIRPEPDSIVDRNFYIRANVCDPTKKIVKHLLQTDLDLFRSVPWFREGVAASGFFDNQIHTQLQQTVNSPS